MSIVMNTYNSRIILHVFNANADVLGVSLNKLIKEPLAARIPRHAQELVQAVLSTHSPYS